MMDSPADSPKHHAATVGEISRVAVKGTSLDNVARFVDEPHSLQKKIVIWACAIVIIGLITAIPFASPKAQSVDGLAFREEGRIVFAGCGMLVALISAGTALSQRAKLRAAALARPDAFVFMTQRTPELIDALKAIGADRPRLPQHFAVTLGPKGIEIWGRGRAAIPRFALAWNEVEYVHPGRLSVETGSIRVTVQALHFFQTVNGHHVALPFTMFGPRGMNRAATRDANKVLNACSPYTSIA